MRNMTAFNNLLSAVEKLNNSYKNEDEGLYWKLEGDKAGNGRAVIRFLSGKTDDSTLFAKVMNHGFKHNGKWYIENCPTTIGGKCPVCDLNSEAVGGRDFKTMPEAEKKPIRDRKRKTSYIMNIMVVDDPVNPDNNGKVFLFKFGQSIFDKIIAKIKPEFDDIKPANPIDWEEGMNFNLRMRRVDGYANFDASDFAQPSPVAGSIQDIKNALHDLEKYTKPDNFKSYEDLAARLGKVMGENSTSRPSQNQVGGNSGGGDDDDDDFLNTAASTVAQTAPAVQKNPESNRIVSAATSGDDDDDDDIDFFRKVAG